MLSTQKLTAEKMLIGYLDSIDLNIWMFQAYLGKDATEGIIMNKK